jgi:hypothetical protein
MVRLPRSSARVTLVRPSGAPVSSNWLVVRIADGAEPTLSPYVARIHFINAASRQGRKCCHAIMIARPESLLDNLFTAMT